MGSTPVSTSLRDDGEPSYIDYETFLSPDFNPASFANSLVLSTNNLQDSPLDLATPLSRVLFDAQEIDSHIDNLTTKSAIPLLEFTQSQTSASQRILSELEAQIQSLNDSYKQLEKEVIDKHAEADEVRQVAFRLWDTLVLGRSVGRCLHLARQLEVQRAEIGGGETANDNAAIIRCAYTIVALREVMWENAKGEAGHALKEVDVIRSLQDVITTPIEKSIQDISERIIREFSVPVNMTFAQGELVRTRLTSAVTTLYLLSPVSGDKSSKWKPVLLLHALETYMRSSLQMSITSLARSLGQLPSLDKALAEVVLRCQSMVALEYILGEIKPPSHPMLDSTSQCTQKNLLQPLLAIFETSSLASYFWRTMAGSLASRVTDIVARGGVVARTLKSNKNTVGDAVRQAVMNGSEFPSAFRGPKTQSKADNKWDREVAVMVGSIVNNLGR